MYCECVPQASFRWAGDANIAIAIEPAVAGSTLRMVPKVSDLRVRQPDQGTCLVTAVCTGRVCIVSTIFDSLHELAIQSANLFELQRGPLRSYAHIEPLSSK